MKNREELWVMSRGALGSLVYTRITELGIVRSRGVFTFKFFLKNGSLRVPLENLSL